MKRLLTVLLLVLAATLAFAQTETARVTGRITDQTGAVVVGAECKITNINTNISVTIATNEEGIYVLPNLKPGTYRLTIAKQGFSTIIKPNLELHVQDAINENFSLAVGSASESVTVSEGAPMVNSQSAAVGTVVDRQFVANLPLSGRTLESLYLLTPGATIMAVTSAGKDLGTFSINGQRASSNYITVDGVSANIGTNANITGGNGSLMSGEYPGLSAFGGTNNLVSVDALEEFRIQTSTYAAEFGRQPGGQISLVTRSGTNQFHGTAFEYLRNDALDARDYFNRAPARKPPLRQNQFGGTFSGPIFKDKTFFFFSYEGQRLRQPVIGTTAVPSTRLRNTATGAVQSILKAFPNPTGSEYLTSTGAASGFAPYQFGFSNPASMDAYSIRIDHTLSSKVTLFGRFNESPSDITVGQAGFYGVQNASATRTATIGATVALSPRLINEFRFNWSRQKAASVLIPSTIGGAVPADPALLTSGLPGASYVYFAFNGYQPQMSAGSIADNYQRQFNIVDNLTLVKGAHQFKFGVDYRRLSPTFAPQASQTVYFLAEASVLSSKADYVSINNNDAARPLFTNWSLYAQDTWKLTPRLTLDAGLRYELNPAPTEADGKMPIVVLGVNPPDVSNATLAPAGTPFYKTFKTAFAPRVGSAYQLWSRSGWDTVLRGGFGVFYDLGSSTATSGYPLSASTTLPAGTPFPLTGANAALPPITVPTSLPIRSSFAYSSNQDLKLPYTLEWNVALEQSFGAAQAVSVSYVASAARDLLTSQLLNMPADQVGPRPNPNFQYILYSWNGPSSDYDSLQTQYRAHFRRGLQAVVNYTWAHAIDEVSSDLNYGYLYRGNADFDIRHNFSAAVVYDLPTPSRLPVVKHIFEGWQVNVVQHAQSGLPFDMAGGTTIVNGTYTFLRPNVVPGQPFWIHDNSVPGGERINPAAFQRPALIPGDNNLRYQGTLGRNVLRSLPIYQTDFALGRTFKLTEGVKVQFKGELFNFFNHPMFAMGAGGRNILSSSSTFGRYDRTLRSVLSNGLVGGLNSLYQMGGPRSVQLSLRLSF